MEQKSKKSKSTPLRKKKRTVAQEEKRLKLLSNILDKWVYVKHNDGVDDYYVFLKHRMQSENSTSKIEQIVLSGDPLSDGIYLITDYDIELVVDKKTGLDVIELKPKKYDMRVGMYAENEIVESFEELKQVLVGAKYLTEDEFLLYCQSSKKPPGIEEMRLTFESKKR